MHGGTSKVNKMTMMQFPDRKGTFLKRPYGYIQTNNPFASEEQIMLVYNRKNNQPLTFFTHLMIKRQTDLK